MAGALQKLKRVGQAAEQAGKKAAQAKKEVPVDQETGTTRVYHGTTKGDITFEPRERGTYFTSNPELANEYTYRNFFRPGSEGAVYPAFLSMENPLIIDAHGKRNDNIPFPGQEWKPKVFGNLPQGAVSVEKAFEKAIQAGHDGLIVRNVVDSADRKGKTKGDIFVVQDPTQIRSAFGGEETPEMPNPDINKAEGGPIDHALKAWHEKTMAKGGKVSEESKESRPSPPNPELLEYMSLDDLVNPLVNFPKRYPGQTVALPSDSASDYNKEVQDRRLKQGAIDAVDWATKNLPQPVNPVMQSLRNILDMRKRKHGGFHPDVREAAGLVDVPEELIPIEDKKSYTPRFNHGGEVHMQGGGDLRAQVERQLAAGVPVFADRGVQGQIAKQILDEQEAARLKEEEERRARIESLPFSERLAGRAEAARTLGSAVGRSMVAPYVAVAKGEEAAKQFAEDVPIPKTEAGAYYTGTAAEMLEGPAKFMQAAKIPDTPLTELVPTQYLPGLGRQLSGIAAKAARGVDAAIPDELKGLPVGGSIQPVGPGGEKLSVNELIRRLEAGEEMTPEQRQRAEYSKAQKEKYAQANIAKAQKEPAPKEELVKVPANDQGFFSSVEKAAANLKREEGSGDAFLSDIMKFNPSAGELEATGIVDFLKGKKSVTRQEVQDYIDQHSVQIEEVVRGTILDDVDRQKLNDINRRISRGFGYTITPEEEEWFEATRERLAQFKEPRFEREGLILPGGKNYKELLLKLPSSEPKKPFYARQSDDGTWDVLEKGGSAPILIDLPDRKTAEIEIEKMFGPGKLQSQSVYRSSHWPDDPNTFMHLRMQDMTIGGKKTLVIEEIQSDWHQEGRKKGYTQPGKEWEVFDPKDGKPIERFATEGEAKTYADKLGPSVDYSKAEGPPEAPFKKDWYQLGVKRLLKYAADNDYDQVALVGPDEQIRRGSLGTHIDGLIYEKNADGTIKLMAEKGESVVLDKTVEPKDLDLYVGKDVAKRILESKETDGTLTGDDLKIGGEGMRQYYGRNYPEYMNKLGRDYGTEAKKTNFVIKEFEPDDVEEVYTGEADRYGREIIAYKVVDRETGDEVAFEYDFDKALKEANKKAPSTDMWIMDLPAKMKADVKVGQPFAKGGAVTKDKDLIRWHKLQEFARGGTVQKLAKAAEKASQTAKRMSREEAEKAGLYHDISGIKLKKPLADVKVVIVDDPKAKMQERVEITPEALYGGASVPMFGDRSDVGKIVKEIEGVPMDVVLEGGGEFMRKHPKHIWASHPDRLEALAKKVRMAGESGRPVYGVHSAMGPQSVDFSTMVTEAIMAGLDLGSLRKEDISAFNQAVKSVKGQGGKPKAPNFPGLEDPELFQKLMSGPGGQRDAFLKAMDKRQFQDAGFPSVAEARYAVTAPRLLDVERGASGYAVGEFDPAGVIEVLSGHKSYPADIRGQYKGALPTLLPVEIMYPTHYGARRMLGATHDAAIKSIESQLPIQYHDQEWLDNAMKYLEMQKKLTGQKKGGLASLKKIRNSRNG